MTINYKKTLVFILYSLLFYNTKEIKRILEEVMIDNNESGCIKEGFDASTFLKKLFIAIIFFENFID